jgi:hypothetical protein
MGPYVYRTIPEELLEFADVSAKYFADLGYTVKPEHHEIPFPYRPTWHCKRSNTTLLVELDSEIRFDRLEDWSRYGRSCTRDTRVGLVIPSDAARSGKDDIGLRELGIGLYIVTGDRLMEAIAPHDLAVSVVLPNIAKLPPRMKKVLGPVYEQFDRSQWREGFEDACQAVESLARRYLKDGISRGRITVGNRVGNPVDVKPKQIDSMPMGELATTFKNIITQNYSDRVIAQALTTLNKDRTNVAHRKVKAATEARLRQNVGQHMWVVVTALKELLGVTTEA